VKKYLRQSTYKQEKYIWFTVSEGVVYGCLTLLLWPVVAGYILIDEATWQRRSVYIMTVSKEREREGQRERERKGERLPVSSFQGHTPPN
jgi:hypothetical protein